MHAPPTVETLGMIGADQFDRMRDGAIYLNSARAALHDLDALDGRAAVGQACPAPGSTTSRARCCRSTIHSCAMTNVVLTPHIGGATYDTEANHTTTHRRRLRLAW